jgi:hypothetical protein
MPDDPIEKFKDLTIAAAAVVALWKLLSMLGRCLS